MSWFTPVTRPRPRPKPGDAPTAELVKLLADPDAWWRETAQRLLFERQDRSVVGALRTMVKERPSATGPAARALDARVAGVARHRHRSSSGLADPEPRVREQAIRLAEARLEREPALLDASCWPWPTTPTRWSGFSSRFRWARSRTIRA